jgi:dTDP-4-amino-4,6-dideoxygalactose transaminase
VGSFGRAAFFSTEETKTISSTMGGMVVTDDPALAQRLRAFQASCARPSRSLTARYVLKLVLYHLLTQPHLHRYTRALYERMGERHPLPRPTTQTELRGLKPPQYARRLSNAQAALALRQLRRLEYNVAHRRVIADAYRARLAERGVDGPSIPAGAEPSYVRYPVWVEDRPKAVRALAPHSVAGTWFTSVLEEAVSAAAGDYAMGSCPRAEAVATHLVNLPTHQRVQPTDPPVLTGVLSGLVGRPGA